jgi:tetratricopeptide (TPR) repeat protein
MHLELPEGSKRHLIEHVRRRVEMASSDDWREFWQARLLALDGDEAEATGKFIRLTAAEDLEVRVAAFEALADAYLAANRFDDALAAISRAEANIDEPKPRPLLLLKRAEVLVAAGQSAAAEQIYRDLLGRTSDLKVDTTHHVTSELARLLVASGRVADARELVNEVCVSFPDNAAFTSIREWIDGI